jgi:hypothetical protein
MSVNEENWREAQVILQQAKEGLKMLTPNMITELVN